MSFLEIEYKYKADGISVADFSKFCESKVPRKTTVAMGTDYFFNKKNSDSTFCRYRTGADINQLTFKRKTEDKNNYVRTEHNIDLALSVDRSRIEALLPEFGYQYNFSMHKSCIIYTFDWYIMVYYICYDEERKELGRFVEIEMSENKEWAEGEAEAELTVVEKLCKPLGLSPQARVKKSLFELFKN